MLRGLQADHGIQLCSLLVFQFKPLSDCRLPILRTRKYRCGWSGVWYVCNGNHGNCNNICNNTERYNLFVPFSYLKSLYFTLSKVENQLLHMAKMCFPDSPEERQNKIFIWHKTRTRGIPKSRWKSFNFSPANTASWKAKINIWHNNGMKIFKYSWIYLVK